MQNNQKRPCNHFTKVCYQGRNAFCLDNTPYTVKEYATFLQWRAGGYKVKKGEKGYHITNFSPCTKINKEGKVEESTSVRTYVVFNIEQVEKI